MRIVLVLVAISVALITSGLAEDRGGSRAIQEGVWADSPATCRAKAIDGLRSAQWALIRITADKISGSSSGTFVKPWNSRGAFATSPDIPDGTPTLFELEKDGRLSETVEGARASGYYVRCR